MSYCEFKLDTFALAHLRDGLLLSHCIFYSFSEQNGSLKRYQKFYNSSQLQYSLFLYFILWTCGVSAEIVKLQHCVDRVEPALQFGLARCFKFFCVHSATSRVGH